MNILINNFMKLLHYYKYLNLQFKRNSNNNKNNLKNISLNILYIYLCNTESHKNIKR